MKINNSKFFTLNEALIMGLKKEIESNPLLLPFFVSNAASKLLKSVIIDSYLPADLDCLLNEIHSLLTFVEQNRNKDEFYTRHLGESKDDFYDRTNIKTYNMYSELFRIRKISDKSIDLIKTINELTHL